MGFNSVLRGAYDFNPLVVFWLGNNKNFPSAADELVVKVVG